MGERSTNPDANAATVRITASTPQNGHESQATDNSWLMWVYMLSSHGGKKPVTRVRTRPRDPGRPGPDATICPGDIQYQQPIGKLREIPFMKVFDV